MNRHILQAVLDYAANSLWQVPLLAGMTWLAMRIGRPRPAARYWIWIATLALAALMPLVTISRTTVAQSDAPVMERSAFVVESGPTMQLPQMPGIRDSFGYAQNTPSTIDAATHAAARKSAWYDPHPILLSENVVLWLLAIYGFLLLVWTARLALSRRAAGQLVRNAIENRLSARDRRILHDCAACMQVRAPRILFSPETKVPMAIGGTSPAILLPENFFSTTDAEMTAALCHELAHLRRGDYAANWACQLGSLPIAYHPATQKILQEIRRTRELACDAMAAAAMQSPAKYAGCLLNLARRTETQTARIAGAHGLFDHDSFEERIMHLIEPDCAARGFSRWARGACAIAFAAASVLTISLFHVAPAMARPTAVPHAVAQQSLNRPEAAVVLQVTRQHTVPVALQAVHPRTAKVQESGTLPTPTALPSIQLAAMPVLPPAAPVTVVPQVKTATPPVPPVQSKVNRPMDAIPPLPPTITPRVPPAPPTVQTKKFKSDAPTVHFRLTPEQKTRIDREVAQAQANMQQAMKRIQSPEFKAQIAEAEKDAEDASRRMQSAEMQRRLKYLQSAAFKKQMAAMQRQIEAATRDMQSAQIQRQLQYLHSAAFKKQMAEMQRQIQEATQDLQKHPVAVDGKTSRTLNHVAPSSGGASHPQ